MGNDEVKYNSLVCVLQPLMILRPITDTKSQTVRVFWLKRPELIKLLLKIMTPHEI